MINLKEQLQSKDKSLYDKGTLSAWFEVKRYYAMNYDFFEMESHSHIEFELMYVASGSCKILCWIKESRPEEWILKEGDYVLIDCNTKHQLDIARGSKCRILNLEISIQKGDNGICLAQLLEQSRSLQDFMNLPIGAFRGYDNSGNLHTIISELHKQLQNTTDDAEHKIMQNLILAQLIIELGRQRTKKYDVESGSKYVRKTLTFLSTYFDQELKIKDIAEEVGISPAYLQRLFKDQTGKTLVDKITELRIEKAKLLLETSSLPITDIAVSVGFNNRQHFSYTFLKLQGCSPAQYRKHKGDYRVWKGFEEEMISTMKGIKSINI